MKMFRLFVLNSDSVGVGNIPFKARDLWSAITKFEHKNPGYRVASAVELHPDPWSQPASREFA